MWTNTISTNWRFGAGDPTLLGWATTAGYGITGLLCFRLGLMARRNPASCDSAAGAWWWLAVVTMALGLNKELDLQTLLIELGRAAAQSEGWYAYRREVQKIFVVGLTVAGAAGTWAVARRYGAFVRQHPGLIAGLGCALLYGLLRAADSDHVTIMPETTSDEDSRLWIIEVLGLGLMIRGAARGAKPPSANLASR